MFTQRLSVTQQDAWKVSPTPLHELGSIAETAEGRVYRYCQAGAVNLTAGKLNIAPAKVANHTAIAVAVAPSLNTKRISVTVGATAVTTGQYDGGYLVVVDGNGVGQSFRISSTPAIASAGTGEILLRHLIKNTIDTSSKVSLQPSLYSGNLVHPGGGLGFFPTGSNNVAVAAGSYYWSQVSGVASVLSDGVIGKGVGVSLTANAIAGAGQAEAATIVNPRIGTAVEATRDTKYDPIFLNIPVY
jgi:hypothetical protein